jgi:hypothetical protein
MRDLPVVVELSGRYYHGVYRVIGRRILVTSAFSSAGVELGDEFLMARAQQVLRDLILMRGALVLRPDDPQAVEE